MKSVLNIKIISENKVKKWQSLQKVHEKFTKVKYRDCALNFVYWSFMWYNCIFRNCYTLERKKMDDLIQIILEIRTPVKLTVFKGKIFDKIQKKLFFFLGFTGIFSLINNELYWSSKIVILFYSVRFAWYEMIYMKFVICVLFSVIFFFLGGY